MAAKIHILDAFPSDEENAKIILIQTHPLSINKFIYQLNDFCSVCFIQTENHQILHNLHYFDYPTYHYHHLDSSTDFYIFENKSHPKVVTNDFEGLFDEQTLIYPLLPTEKKFNFILKYISPIFENFFLFLQESKFIIEYKDVEIKKVKNYKNLIIYQKE